LGTLLPLKSVAVRKLTINLHFGFHFLMEWVRIFSVVAAANKKGNWGWEK
jgi:hypothetical protein